MQNHPRRNPLVILIFSCIGMAIRYVLFYLLSVVKGTTPKKIQHFSEGFKQVVFNLLLTVFIFIILIVLFIYYSFKTNSY